MKHAWTAAALAVAAMAASAPGMAHDNSPGAQCGPGTLDGLYVLAASGFSVTASGTVPKAIIEQIDFNGHYGGVSPNAFVMINGVQPPAGTNSAVNYTNDGDCTFTFTFPSGPAHRVYMDPDGEKGWTIMTNPGNVFQGTLTRVWPHRDRDERR